MNDPQQADEDEENRNDFELLRKQLSIYGGGIKDGTQERNEKNIWPLQLRTIFIDHYIFGDSIGAGSYAEVRECIDTRTLRRCAVKIIDKNYLKKQAPKALANQMQEIRLLKYLNHPNVISLIECRFKGPKVYIFLEHCTFVLHDLLQEQIDGRFHCSQMIRNLFEQLANGLAHLHSVGIVHRDIKPQNLLITNCGHLKIIDFGVSQLLSMWSRSDLCSHNEGSPLFQAPEIISGGNSTTAAATDDQTAAAAIAEAAAATVDGGQYAGFKVDVWSAGVTLYLMLFGCYPFEDEALLGLYDKILSEELKFPNGIEIPSKLVACDLLYFMLDKNHLKRATIEEVLEHPWLKLSHSADHSEGSLYNEKHSEFLELTQRRRHLARISAAATTAAMEGSQSNNSSQSSYSFSASNKWKDVYESMSVIPYLHNYHFPQTRVRRASSASSSKSSSSSSSTTTTTTTGRTTVTATADTTPNNSPTFNDPNEIIKLDDDNNDDDEHTVEWGTAEQYSLLKVPLVRANRLNPRAHNHHGRT